MKILYLKDNNLKEYEEEIWGIRCLCNVIKLIFMIYFVKGVNFGKVVLIILGGGYEIVVIYYEGYDLVEVFLVEGIMVVVLKYRILNVELFDLLYLVFLIDV